MAKVQVQVAGGSIQQKEVGTVRELAQSVNATGYQATVNGEPVSEGYELSDFEFVSFAKPVKAGILPQWKPVTAGSNRKVWAKQRRQADTILRKNLERCW